MDERVVGIDTSTVVVVDACVGHRGGSRTHSRHIAAGMAGLGALAGCRANESI